MIQRIGNDASTAIASLRSSSSIAMPMPTISRTDVTRVTTPPVNICSIASMSEVCREITRPDVYRSWNDMLSRWKCMKTRRRRSSSTSCPTRPVRSRNPLNVVAPTRVTTTNPTIDRRERLHVAAPSVEQRRDALVDGFLHEPRAQQLADGVDDDQDEREREQSPVRAQQRGQQRPTPAPQHAREPAARLLDFLRRDTTPRVDARVAGQVERPVGRDVGDLVRFEHHAMARPSSPGASSASAA